MCAEFTTKDIERFWKHVDRSGGPDACWPWTAYRNACGYGVMSMKVDGRWTTQLTHRVAWMVECGPIPAGMSVCHRCDRPWCVRRSHLFLGTQRENMHDSLVKGRRSSLMPDDVRQILELVHAGYEQVIVAQMTNTTLRAVVAIATGRTWKFVERPEGWQSSHRRLKLSDEDVLELHELAFEMTQYELAERFGISQAHVSNVLNGKYRKLPH